MDYKSIGFLHEQFVDQVRKTPHKMAVVDVRNRSLSYEELDKITDKLAAVFQDLGVTENSVVIIYMEKCLQYVLTYLAILKAGGAYLPIDVSYPPSLIEDIIKESEPHVIISTKDRPVECYTKLGSTHAIYLEDSSFLRDIDQMSSSLKYTLPNLSTESLAFVVYSSGTTGKPKGISVPYRAPMLSYRWRHDTYPYEGEEHEACNVFFVWELIRPLLRGQTLYIIPDDTIYDPPKLLIFLKDHSITRMLFTPSLLETVLEFSKESVTEGFKSMKQVWLCGEVTTTTMIGRAMTLLPHVQFINLYSISECHDVAAINLTSFYHEKPEKLSKSKFTPVGHLLPNVKVVILDKERKIQPVGLPGEMYVYGPTLALEYLKRPDITSQKFIPLHFDLCNNTATKERMYKTGDWGYLLSDQSLEICGRCDAMVKIRGYSVEMSAIENIIMDLSYVQSCVVVTFGEEGEDKYLVAYIVANKPTTTRKIRGELKRRLPFYMIPSYFMFIKEIPILPGSGKLNKKALPPLNKNHSESKSEIFPKTETEKVLAEIWSQVLQIHSIDIQESFFDLGGHSLLAAKLMQIVNNKFTSNLSVKELYMSPTITGMAKLIEGKTPKLALTSDLSKEVEVHGQYDVDLDIQLRAFWRFSSLNKTRWSGGCVLLTGSTGYLGAFILAELLKSTESHVFCLVRENLSIANSGHSGEIEKRLLDTLGQYLLLGENETDSERMKHIIRTRVTVVKGDVSLINFGLLKDDYRYLSTEIDCIIHAAAYVNLVYPYSALSSSNVMGTCNVVNFSSISKIKPLHYISTDAIFPNDFVGKEYSDVSNVWTKLKSGYAQSKWVAEQMVLKSSQKGHPCVIYRLGNQAPDSVNGAVNQEDFNFMIIRSFFHLGYYPKMKWCIEMTPVNFTARVIVECVKSLPDHVGKIYHLINQQPLELQTLTNWMTMNGYKSESVSYECYLERLKNANVTFITKLYTMLSEVANSDKYFRDLPQHDSTWTITFLESADIHYPELTNSLLTLYFAKLLTQNLIPAHKHSPYNLKLFEDNTLYGKVVVVTGASSGIGEETAVYLARSKCLVALLARREDKLTEVKEIITSLGGRALAIKTDISKEDEVERAINSVETMLGPIDILINCAGLMYYQKVFQSQMSDSLAMIDVNIKGLLLCTSKVLPKMVERKSGHIVNISSDAGKIGFPGLAVYSGTKFFVEGYSQALRKEVSSLNIKVTCIQPGDVATPLLMSSTVDKTAKEFFPDNSNIILQAVDVAKTIVFALSCPSYMAINEILVEPISAPI